MSNDDLTSFLADTFREIGQLLIEKANRLDSEQMPEWLKIHANVPIVALDERFIPCPRCRKDAVLLDYGDSWMALCPVCQITLVGSDKDDLMEAWNNLKLDEKGDWSDETTQSTGKTEGEITDV